MMVPAAVVDQQITDLLPLLDAGDILIDGGNSYYVDDIRRAKDLAPGAYIMWTLERAVVCGVLSGDIA
jgi:6-phosphogluconate dehydrogenase (decarboxylating)